MNGTQSDVDAIRSKPVIVACDDLEAAIAEHIEQRGYRLEMIMPADAPRIALLSRDGQCVHLKCATHASVASNLVAPQHLFSVERASSRWQVGRAGMQYRDLIPDRLGGHFIASHIRIPDGGPVPDYVHYHKVGFQMIFCRRGWVRVVYEDQGKPFVMQAGDCVLQPPTIRHRVLDASPGLEVIEVGAPAEHETWREYAFDLPTPTLRPKRRFGGQLFLHDVAALAQWNAADDALFSYRETGIVAATDGLARVRELQANRVDRDPAHWKAAIAAAPLQSHHDALMLLFVLDGCLCIELEDMPAQRLRTDDACVIPSGV
ncbi:MAG: cupin domain-containing protein, partial [Dokdonella sp.]